MLLQMGADGIGKIIDFDEETAEVEYFESPAGPSLRTVRVPVAVVNRDLGLGAYEVFRRDQLPSSTRHATRSGGRPT